MVRAAEEFVNAELRIDTNKVMVREWLSYGLVRAGKHFVISDLCLEIYTSLFALLGARSGSLVRILSGL
jgi:hypothetical protein